jgi:hypothetical protein
VTGCIRPSHLSRLNPSDSGGQYDSSGGAGGLGNPQGSVCLGCVLRSSFNSNNVDFDSTSRLVFFALLGDMILTRLWSKVINTTSSSSSPLGRALASSAAMIRPIVPLTRVRCPLRLRSTLRAANPFMLVFLRHTRLPECNCRELLQLWLNFWFTINLRLGAFGLFRTRTIVL